MIGFRFTEGLFMKDVTDEMDRLNQICEGYLKSIPADTRMYRNGHKWTRAGEMAEFNDRRIQMIQRMAGGRKW